MSDTRAVAQRYMDLLCLGRFSDAFDLLAPTAVYQVIGTTPLSKPIKGRDAIKATLVPALTSFRKAPELKFKELIVEGKRAVGLASGHGVGPTGLPYDQPFYAMVLRVEDGEIQEVEEYMDTLAVETALCGKKLVAA